MTSPVSELQKINPSSIIELFQLELITAIHGSNCLLYTSPSPRDVEESRMPSSA